MLRLCCTIVGKCCFVALDWCNEHFEEDNEEKEDIDNTGAKEMVVDDQLSNSMNTKASQNCQVDDYDVEVDSGDIYAPFISLHDFTSTLMENNQSRFVELDNYVGITVIII